MSNKLKYILLFLILLVLVYLQSFVNLQLPDYMADIINIGIVDGNQSYILDTGTKMIGITIFGAVCAVFISLIAARIGTGFAKDLRRKVFEKVESFSLTEFNKFSTSSLITRTTNDIQQVQQVTIMILRMVLSAPIVGVWAVYKAYKIAPSMTWIMGLAVAILITIILVIFFVVLPKFAILQKLIDKLNLVSRQNLTGIKVIRAFNTQEFEKEKFDQVNKDLTKTNLFTSRLMIFMQPTMMLIFNLTNILIVWVGAHLIETQDIHIGDMMAFMQYAMQVIMSFLMISIVFIMIPRASISAKRIKQVLNTKLSIKDPKQPKSWQLTQDSKGKVEFKNVTFSYPGAPTPVLQNISFIANPGETTAIIGGTGSGKSTIVSLIPRFFDVVSGEVLVDDLNIKEVKQHDLHNKIGFVPQKGVLFSGTIKSNIKFGKSKISDEQMINTAKISQANEFIDQLESKYDNQISQGGKNVSGGQKQRLAIARAVILSPDIYIFDDSFSALDLKTDLALRKALKQKTKNSTVIIVAQRIGTILDADKIIVLDKGKIVDIGTHDTLMQNSAIYKEIALSQLSEKEL